MKAKERKELDGFGLELKKQKRRKEKRKEKQKRERKLGENIRKIRNKFKKYVATQI